MQLQKGPSGILGWFALKVTGRNPPQFGDAVVPVVEIGDNYLATSELIVDTLSSNVGLTTFNSRVFTVPNGKAWRLIAAGGAYSPNAADVAVVRRLAVDIKSPNSAPLGVPIASGQPDNTGVNSIVGVALRPPIFLPSGFSVTVSLFSATAWTVAAPFAAELLYQQVDL